MPKSFDIPEYYRSPVVSQIKRYRREHDQRKKDLSPTCIDLGEVRFFLARHFGLCFGVENAIEIAYRAISENPGKRIFLLSEMIHNPRVNADLEERGISFLQDTKGNEKIPFSTLTPEDVVIVPAFGTSLEIFAELERVGVDVQRYNATCPFVEKVWKRSEQLGEKGFSVVIHGKHTHEETRATFSHAKSMAPSIVVRDLTETLRLCEYIRGERSLETFFEDFEGRTSSGFDPEKDLIKLGVVNQTTMLAEDTREISAKIREALLARYGEEQLSQHFADTRDTLCYATSENQSATRSLVTSSGDLALIVGGYNSSNTSHLYELCAEEVPSYFIKDADEILSPMEIQHLNLESGQVETTRGWLTNKKPLDILVTAGASCPDALVDEVMFRVSSFFGVEEKLAPAVSELTQTSGKSALSVLQ